MTPSSEDDCLDILQTAPYGDKVQLLAEILTRYFRLETIPDKRAYSKVECMEDESKVLDEVREEFKKEFVRSQKITNIVQAIVPSSEKKYYMSLGVRLLVFQNGLSNLVDLAPETDCIILIPVSMAGAGEATLYEPTGRQRQMNFTFKTNSELVIISGRCSVDVPPNNKVVCVVLCIGKDKK